MLDQEPEETERESLEKERVSPCILIQQYMLKRLNIDNRLMVQNGDH